MNHPIEQVSLSDMQVDEDMWGVARARTQSSPDTDYVNDVNDVEDLDDIEDVEVHEPMFHPAGMPDPYCSTSAYACPDDDDAAAMTLLHTQLALRWFNDERHRSLAIVSADPRDERSVLAARLAIACARAGNRTLLIDADMRIPSVHFLFDKNNDVGLASVLAGDETLQNSTFAVSLDNLWILCAGTATVPPENLLTKARLSKLLTQAALDFDVILIDTPQMPLFADAQSIADVAGAVLMTVRRHQTQARALSPVAAELRGMGVTIVGSVFI